FTRRLRPFGLARKRPRALPIVVNTGNNHGRFRNSLFLILMLKNSSESFSGIGCDTPLCYANSSARSRTSFYAPFRQYQVLHSRFQRLDGDIVFRAPCLTKIRRKGSSL